ncbi:MAG: sigma-70 family RNA polymerase sigma factor [Deltaproteobacteria bacterium]|nr:sigma-70 family RNA polymerase sigma factor [Deltaproteobacteria bacterium]
MEARDHGRFETLLLPHLDAAYDLARWLTKSDADAQDAVQEAYLRALRFFDGFRSGDARPWILQIVRNCCFDLMRRSRAFEPLDDEAPLPDERTPDPETKTLRGADAEALEKALDELPPEFREVIVLYELEELPYREIARVTGVPIGTVMSRLSRARRRLRVALGAAAGAQP